jgi:predicted  nucleic acid-binding Zn-ribbon protein
VCTPLVLDFAQCQTQVTVSEGEIETTTRLERTMTSFQEAYDAVVARYSADRWAALTPSEITEAIYQEMRRLDAEVADVEHKRSQTNQHPSPTLGASPIGYSVKLTL